jgi:hypothetical protein
MRCYWGGVSSRSASMRHSSSSPRPVRGPPSSAQTRTTRNTPASAGSFARPARIKNHHVQISCLGLEDGKSSAAASFAALINAEAEVSTRKGQTLGARLARTSVAPIRPLCLRLAQRGSLMDFRPVPQSKHELVKDGGVKVRVNAIGMNFHDVLNVMGLYFGDPGVPGLDCSGSVVNAGINCKIMEVRCGNDAFGLVWDCPKTYGTCKERS